MANSSSGNSSSLDPLGKNILETIQKANHYNNWLFNLIKPNLQGEIIDIGAGIGNFTDLLLKDKYSITATDYSQNYLDLLQKQYPKLSTFNFDLTSNSTPRAILNKFDTAICFNVLEHIATENLALQNIRNSLKTGGKLIILVPAFQLAFGKLDRNLGHFRRYTKKSLINTLVRNGYTIENIRYLNPLGLIGWWINGKILHRGTISTWQIMLFEFFSRPILFLEQYIPFPFGLSVIAIART